LSNKSFKYVVNIKRSKSNVETIEKINKITHNITPITRTAQEPITLPKNTSETQKVVSAKSYLDESLAVNILN